MNTEVETNLINNVLATINEETHGLSKSFIQTYKQHLNDGLSINSLSNLMSDTVDSLSPRICEINMNTLNKIISSNTLNIIAENMDIEASFSIKEIIRDLIYYQNSENLEDYIFEVVEALVLTLIEEKYSLHELPLYVLKEIKSSITKNDYYKKQLLETPLSETIEEAYTIIENKVLKETISCPHCNYIGEESDFPNLFHSSDAKHSNQFGLLCELQSKGYNIVTCTNCGKTFIIKQG